ncbi:MAG: hypothetical protein ACRCYU_19500 [Nocardioides sp.]
MVEATAAANIARRRQHTLRFEILEKATHIGATRAHQGTQLGGAEPPPRTGIAARHLFPGW